MQANTDTGTHTYTQQEEKMKETEDKRMDGQRKEHCRPLDAIE